MCVSLLAYPSVPAPIMTFPGIFYMDKALESFSESFLCVVSYLILFLIL